MLLSCKPELAYSFVISGEAKPDI